MIKKIFYIMCFIFGAVFTAYNPQYIDWIKEKWEYATSETKDYIEKVKEENETVKELKEKIED